MNYRSRMWIAGLVFGNLLWSCTQRRLAPPVGIPGDKAVADKLIRDSTRSRLALRIDTVNKSVSVYGKNWFSNLNNQSPVEFYLDNVLIKEASVKYSNDGSFLLQLPPLEGVSLHSIKAIQHNKTGEKKEVTLHFKPSFDE